MYEVMHFGFAGIVSTYLGDNWIKAMSSYYTLANRGQHVILWEGTDPAREFHPTLGHM